MPKRAGRPSAAQTPAPKSDKIYGSKKNPKGSATEKKAKSIQLSDKTINTLKEKLDKFKKSHPAKKSITLGDLKAVYRRGSGAYSSSHRPTITGGAPNSRAAWSYARVNKFLKKAGGAKVKAAYVQDDDLMAKGGEIELIGKIQEYSNGGADVSLWNQNDDNVGYVEIRYDKVENLLYAPYKLEGIGKKEYISDPQYKILTDDLKKFGIKTSDNIHYIEQIEIYEEFRGKGYASQALRDAIDFYKDEGVDFLLLTVGADTSDKGALTNKNLIEFYKRHGFKVLNGSGNYKNRMILDLKKYAKGGVPKGGDCYEAAAQFCMGSVYMAEPVEFVGEPYLVHAEVKGQGKAEGIRFGHAWVEDDENVYDYSNGRRIVMPKVVYYAIGDVQTENPLKYQRYTFSEARAKMLKTKHYGSWDIETEYADGGLMTEGGYKVYVNDEYRRTITDENLKEYYLTKGFQMNDGKLQIYGQDISFEDGGLIAPNGKPSNLTAEQYKLVRTPEFKAWFGDWENDPENASKVVDKNGEPMVVYHGTRKKVFYEFKNYYQLEKKKLPTDRLELHFFSNNKDKARYYGSKNIYECFLNMKNPLYYATGDGVPEEAIFQQNKDGFISESNISSILAVPNSQQIKLADGTNKTFDSNNPDIRFEDGGVMADGGQPSQLVTCINCSWEWETADSAEFDKYVCHQCGFDNSLFYDGGLLKPTMPINQIAEKHGVSIEYLEEQLNKGLQHEKEHTDSDEVATSIALHHLAERPDYYEELEKMKLEHGGEVTISDEDYEFWIGGDENLGKAIKQDGKIVGGIAYDEDEQQIYGIVIKNKFRKKGIAKKAIKALFDKNPDLDRVYVRAVPESKGFWKKIGTDFDNYNEDAGLWEGYVKRFEDGGDIDLFGKIDILEDNSPEDVEIADFLKQQKDEAQMVMTCDDSKIYKAMICKTKCEIADKRMSETENPEELNAWNSYKNIWNECLESILNDDMDKYKVGGKTCGCGCGSIYSKGGIFSKGGLAYGNSHDKGGMPMKVKSTGQNIEIEGGEGVTNKRSMQMTKKVEFEGQKMTPCEVVSKINEMGGGVKFKCSDVKNIIEEDGHF